MTLPEFLDQWYWGKIHVPSALFILFLVLVVLGFCGFLLFAAFSGCVV